ncbi:structure-specific endonuclease subunit SLX4 [Dasypus novemcinctus]|uniref:structure-specific endonuclease subunit SLX4 n=1 Tax=Dasypus novemcinctus TaxID=9361 RepID=UPI000328FF3C|nr:structure-specific endonuclease subunit SLX4 [Dasypus novemcinctus]XP_004474395.1 structure-specific endonuclease subunit SLX4 [Dasypus novemcinctus]XP_004474396.1 structure-specific endonuclease subunit SLX4 [Dasypus novemcinctus]
MMDESDDDFKELCANFFQRVKKNGNKEVSEGKKTQRASQGTQIRSKLKRTKQTTTKRETPQGPVEKKPRSSSQVPRTKKPRTTKPQESGTAPTVNGERDVLAPAWDQQGTRTGGAPSSDSQPPPSCLTAVVPSPSKSRTAELVVQRMQQFKRADPQRLKHAFEECSVEAAAEGDVPEGPREEAVVGHGDGPGPPATESDAAVASALQQEFGQECTAAHADNLEEKGWFFCQICQKNLSAMNVTRREQHVNRCLDEAEKAARPPAPQVPECPICGKQFLTAKSRSSHLKQCAAKMEVCPQLLLQAVRLQAAQPEGGCGPAAAGFSNQVGGLKRKGAASKEPQKRRKISKAEAPSEDLLVAVALSRSEMERPEAVPTLRLENAFSERIKLGAEKKRRKKKLPVSPPQLLVQDSETTGRQIEDRVATLFAEKMEWSSTPPLPMSRISKEKLEMAGWRLQLPEMKNVLWEGSALTGAWASASFYTASLVPPIVPLRAAQGVTEEPTGPSVPPEQPNPDAQTPLALSSPPAGCSYREDPEEPDPRKPSPSSSQRERQALRDLMDLAGEGPSPSQWPSSGGLASSGGAAGADLVLNSLPLTGFVLPPKDKPLERDGSASLCLGLLASDFGAMVNNPQLSDVQLQLDGGEVLYAHKFVLYARCPLLIQHVNSEGFFVVEDGNLRTQRVLLSDVSPEATCAFLRYLYAGDTGLPSQLIPDLSSLARRFGVSELVHLCQQVPVAGEAEGGRWEEKEEDDCEGREENFRELLRSMWAGEEEETEALLKSEDCKEDRENVNEAEMEEIYEFAATQRKLLQEERATERDEEADDVVRGGPGSPCVLASIQVSTGQVDSSRKGRDESPPKRPVLPPHGQGPGGEEDAEHQWALEELLGQRQTSSPAGEDRAERKGGSPRHSFDDTGQRLSPAQREHTEPSQKTRDRDDWRGTVMEKGAGASRAPCHHQVPPSQPCGSPPRPPRAGSPPRSRLRPQCSRESSPFTLQSPSTFAPVGSPNPPSPIFPPKQKRDRSVLTLLTDPGCQEGRVFGYMWERKSKGVLIAPQASPSIDLTQPTAAPSSSRPGKAPGPVSRDDEVILLLDSDEELELEQTQIKPASHSPPEERNALETSHRSSELFSVIDIDADQEHSRSPPPRAAAPPPGPGADEGSRGPSGVRGPLRLCFDEDSSTEEDATADTSWLVPATPLAGRSRDRSSQTQVTGLGPGAAGDQKTQPWPWAFLENREGNEAPNKLSVIVPQASSSYGAPLSPGSPDGGRQGHRSPSWRRPRLREHFAPAAPRGLLGGPAECAEALRPRSSPEPSPARQAPASEVVEVTDSDEEQEVACRRASSSPHVGSDPPIPVDDCCWNEEPLSPIPIDHLNLERTGPLSTSSPSPRARATPGHRDPHSPGLLGTTPIRGKRSPEKSPRAGSPGRARPSFLNSALWDDWDGDEQAPADSLPQAPGPSAGPAQKSEGVERPEGANRRKNLPPKVPITPMPRYSILETPVLKRELDRFGVRPLPKRQMVLKLKEIFQYTHQTLGSDSDDEAQAPHGQTQAPHTSQTARAGGCSQLEATAGPAPQGIRGPVKAKGPGRRKQARVSPPALRLAPAEDAPRSPDADVLLPASQEPMASADGSDSSFGSQSSSSSEFGAALESGGDDEEGEEGVTASQVAGQAADAEEAVRRYIRSNPALYRKILLYQPFELAELQAELRQHGVRVPAAKLLDFLDTHCVTFTTAAARKEQLRRKRRPPRAKKKGERN